MRPQRIPWFDPEFLGRTGDPHSEESKKLMWRIIDEIWNRGQPELMDELIAEDLVDHVDVWAYPDKPRHRELSADVRGLCPARRLRLGRD
jgi:hypothetical protein